MDNSRRRLLVALGTITIFGGCAGNRDGSATTSPPTSSDPQTETATATDTAPTQSKETETPRETDQTESSLIKYRSTELRPADPDSGAYADDSADMSDDGNTAVIGKYVFVRSDDSWQQQADLVADDGGDGFGASAAVSNDGNTAVIGDPSDSASDSAAYVFARSGESWTEEAKLAAATSDSGFYFGESADISGDGSTVIIGDITGKSSNGKRTGAAHVFALSGGEWQEQARLAASDGDQDDRFGARVGLSSDGNTAIIGSDADKTIDGEYAGSAYVFSRSDKNWEQQTKLSADDGDSEDFFGTSVGISGDGSTAIACAHRDEDPNGENAGSAYVFTRSGEDWTQKTKLAPADGDSNDRFGYTVDLSADGDTAIFGAYWDDDPNGEKAGSAYVFTRSGGSWSETAKLAPEDSGAGDALGYSIGVSSDGTPALVAGGSSAYLFELVS